MASKGSGKKKPPVYVVNHPDGWAVKREGSSRASSVHRTQKEAEKQGRQTASKENTELFIQNKQGQFRKRDTSGGSDPRKSEG